MAGRRSSPYLILGVPFAATRDEAARGFAKAVKRLRRMDDPPFDLEDLNWAQHEIDHREGHVDHSLDDFRVPADPSAYSIAAGVPTISRSVEPLTRRTSPTEPSVIDELRVEVVLESLTDAVRGAVENGSLPALPASFIIRER